jgi:hypothetical protein
LSPPSQWPAIVPIITEERGFGDILLVTKQAGASSDCKHWARQRQIHQNTTEDCKDDLFQQHPFCGKGSVAGADIPTEAVAQVAATQELEQHQQPTGSITPEIELLVRTRVVPPKDGMERSSLIQRAPQPMTLKNNVQSHLLEEQQQMIRYFLPRFTRLICFACWQGED